MAVPSSRKFTVELFAGFSLEILIKEEELKSYTCQRLLEDVIFKAKEAFPNEPKFDEIVALQTIAREYAVDHWLNHPKKRVSMIKDGKALKPFYRQRISEEDKVSLDNFIVETKLGRGAFSSVYLVRKKDTGYLYALKQIIKSNLSTKKQEMLLNERQAMLDINSPYVSGLIYSFQTDNHCYFVMDFIPCGDLHRISKNRKNQEDEVRFYIAETILALNAIHMESYIYRDLKPENLLLDLDGHIRLTDLGLAKQVYSLTDLNFSRCGTAQVMAPEILSKRGYNFMVDYYNLGTLTYELFTGTTPSFTLVDRIFLEENNSGCDKMSDELKDFIKRLLDTEPKVRLGNQKGLKEIINHPWLSSMDFSKLSQKRISPPLGYDPNAIKYSEETFVGMNIDMIGVKIPQNDEDNYLPNFSFYGFGSSLVLMSNEPKDPQVIVTEKITEGQHVSNKRDQNENNENVDTYGMEIGTLAEKFASFEVFNKKTMGILQDASKFSLTSQKALLQSNTF